MNNQSTQQKIDAICQELEDIFKPMNETLCPVCPHPFKPSTVDGITGTRGCCTNCAARGGYGAYDRLGLLKKKYGFDKNTGFFDDEKKRCRLPRAERSGSCQAFTCDEGRAIIGTDKALRAIKLSYELVGLKQKGTK